MAKHDLAFDPPIMNAAGSLGFFPDFHSSIDWSSLGAFVTNPVSLTPRTPAHGRRFHSLSRGLYPSHRLSQPRYISSLAPTCRALEPLPSAGDRPPAGTQCR